MAAHARKILLGFDGSEASRRALDVAARLTGYGSLLSVVTVSTEGGGNGQGELLLDEAHERLLGQHVTATYAERFGEPAQELVDAARELDVDLVVVGRRGLNVDGEPLPGSVSEEVVRTASCDVLVVR